MAPDNYTRSVSYTHLDVYKRQSQKWLGRQRDFIFVTYTPLPHQNSNNSVMSSNIMSLNIIFVFLQPFKMQYCTILSTSVLLYDISCGKLQGSILFQVRSIIGSHEEGLAYLCGHLHTLGGVVPNMYTLQQAGFLELELADWKSCRM